MVKEGQIPGIGHFIQEFTSVELIGKLVLLSETEGPFVVKTHSQLTPGLKELLLDGKIKATYIHRDPRDVILSAIDHGKRSYDDPSTSFFRQFDAIENTAPFVAEFCRVGIAWLQSGLTEEYTYNALIKNPVAELARFSKLVGIEPEAKFVNEIIRAFTLNQQPGVRQYNTGKSGRFMDEMDKVEIATCNDRLREFIMAMGYPI